MSAYRQSGSCWAPVGPERRLGWDPERGPAYEIDEDERCSPDARDEGVQALVPRSSSIGGRAALWARSVRGWSNGGEKSDGCRRVEKIDSGEGETLVCGSPGQVKRCRQCLLAVGPGV